MAFIRKRTEERTGFQNGLYLNDIIDNQCDFVMVYRYNETTRERIEKYREKGYVIHFMCGISWGAYQDYLKGEYDGRNHWDEAQTDRNGNQILHGVDTPYMVPTVSFADYITNSLKPVVDAGVEAIHVEEPEFWDRAGYSEAFKREFELYYRQKWTPPHESVDARYKCAKLKAYLFTRTIDRVSSGIKEYAKVKYNKDIRFYVPTHSLINYTQWKIVSPEGKLSDIPSVDGCIAQVWTGTSREKNWFNGEFKERTFETAYLEYGVMQELVKGTGRTMWFLHDPIEDNPIFDWNDYRTNYLCTVAASLLHPKVNTFEICPWPNRVFENTYPKGSPDATLIPAEYATILNNTFNTLGTLEECEEEGLKVGILTGDGELYQREYPDNLFSKVKEQEVGTVLRDSDELIERIENELCKGKTDDKELLLEFMSSSAFPGFFSLALPLLKYGVHVRPVLLENARRFTGYLDDYKILLLSYEFMKPEYPDINNAIAEWVRSGGTLIYVGDGFDPYNEINSWWTGKYKNPAEHLFKMLGIDYDGKETIIKCGNGTVGVLPKNPALFGCSFENAEKFRSFFEKTVANENITVEYKNHLMLKRNEYIIAAVLDESISDEPLEIKGDFADMFASDFNILHDVTLLPGEKCMLMDLNEIKDEKLRIIGTSVRVNSMEQCGNSVKINIYGASNFKANIRIKTPFEIKEATIDGEKCEFVYDEKSKTVLLSFDSVAKEREIILK